MDGWDIRGILPRTRIAEAGKFRIGLVHGDGPGGGTTMERVRQAFDDVHCIIFGHSHSLVAQQYDGLLMINPGSPTDKRRAPHPSFALLTVEDILSVEIVYV